MNLPHENGLGVLFWGPQTDGAIARLVGLLQTDGGASAAMATFDLAGELRMQANHGVPYNVHQAAAHGVPVVATTLLARQLGWQDGRHLLVADTPEAFANAVAQLHGNAQLWADIRAGALERVAQDCGPAIFAAALRKVINMAPPAISGTPNAGLRTG